MNAKVRAPSHVCHQCGEWWVVEPLAQDRWLIVRYGDVTDFWSQVAFAPQCPDCPEVVLDLWQIDAQPREKSNG
jgi:hypothetical protein